MSKFVCVLPFPDGDARRHRDLSWFGQEKALRPAGGREFVLSCTEVLVQGRIQAWYGVCEFYCVSVSSDLFLSLSFYSSKERPRVHA